MKLIVEPITSGPWRDQPLLVIYTNVTLGIPCGVNTTIRNYTGPHRLILLDVSEMGLERNDKLLLCTFDNGVEVRGTVSAEEWGDPSMLAVLKVEKSGIVSRYSTVSHSRRMTSCVSRRPVLPVICVPYRSVPQLPSCALIPRHSTGCCCTYVRYGVSCSHRTMPWHPNLSHDYTRTEQSAS